eukprot:GHVS01023915.1.p1 GENE.GHVS01023915.1~~GHVS01023915.1.p1  ORF type:complete len:652 (+),score=73.60 GHVS01023915.1:2-1957(+)
MLCSHRCCTVIVAVLSPLSAIIVCLSQMEEDDEGCQGYVDYFSTSGQAGASSPTGDAEVLAANTSAELESLNYGYWKKNLPFLYSGLLIQHLEWPSLTVDWLTPVGSTSAPTSSYLGGSVARRKGGGVKVEYSVQKVTLGTHTSGKEPDYLIVADVRFPRFCPEEDPLRSETSSGYCNPRNNGGAAVVTSGVGSNPAVYGVPHFEVKAKLLHPGEVNRALHMPQHSFTLASQSPDGQIYIFDYAKHPSVPTTTFAQPQIILHQDTSCAKPPKTPCQNVPVGSMEVDIPTSRSPKNTAGTVELSEQSSSRRAVSAGGGDGGDAICHEQEDAAKSSVDGFGLSWNKAVRGRLASSDNGGRISVWDINGTQFQRVYSISFQAGMSGAAQREIPVERDRSELLPLLTWNGCNDGGSVAVNDVMWHPGHCSVLGSGGDDGYLRIWDCRTNHKREQQSQGVINARQENTSIGSPNYLPPQVKPAVNENRCKKSWLTCRDLEKTSVGTKGVRTIAFNQHSEHVVASGGDSNDIRVWDLRRVREPLCLLRFHTGCVNRLSFSPGAANILASASDDKLVVLWNLNEASNQPPKQLKEASTDESARCGKEVMFVHGGHRGSVGDIAWCNDPKAPWLIASTGNDNCLQAWSPSDDIFASALR